MSLFVALFVFVPFLASLTGDVAVTPQDGPYGPGADIGFDISGDVSGSAGIGFLGGSFEVAPSLTVCLFGPKC